MREQLQSHHILEIHGEQYYAEPSSFPLIQLPLDSVESGGYSLATVVHHNGPSFGLQELQHVQDDYSRRDDVWTPAFLEVILLKGPSNIQVSPDLQKSHKVITLDMQSGRIAPGPYVISTATGGVFPIYKLYGDPQMAFVGGVVQQPDTKGNYRWIKPIDRVPVTSRLYSDEEAGQSPLKGLRFAVKDVIDVAGLETGNGSLCWAKTYPAREASAPFITQLIEAGAILVGKLRCSQFCDGQDPMERFEEVTPFNPRGDGFQKPSATSTGSAVACASYPWIDFTVGTDTGGSVRAPAGVNGVFGLRPTLNSVESRGLVLSALMDTVGLFTRSLDTMQAVSNCIMKQSEVSIPPSIHDKVRFRLLVATESPNEPRESPRFFPPDGVPISVPNPEALDLFERTISTMEEVLGQKRENVCLYDLWKQTHPDDTLDSLEEATGSIYKTIVYRNLHQDILLPFIRDHQTSNSGNYPYIEPLLSDRMDFGAQITSSEYGSALDSFRIFSNWVQKTLLPIASQEGEGPSSTTEVPILVFPQSWGLPQYRDKVSGHNEGKLFWDGFSVYSISYCSGCPDITVPIGQVEFDSKMTRRKEFLPVALSFASPVGTDLALVHFLQRLEAAGVLKTVECGTKLYKQAD